MTRNRLCSTFAWWIRRENSWKLRSKNTFSCFEKIKRSLRVPPFSRDCHKNCNFPNLWIHYYIFESQLSVSAGVDDDNMACSGRPTAVSARDCLKIGRLAGMPSCLPGGGLIEEPERKIREWFSLYLNITSLTTMRQTWKIVYVWVPLYNITIKFTIIAEPPYFTHKLFFKHSAFHCSIHYQSY